MIYDGSPVYLSAVTNRFINAHAEIHTKDMIVWQKYLIPLKIASFFMDSFMLRPYRSPFSKAAKVSFLPDEQRSVFPQEYF